MSLGTGQDADNARQYLAVTLPAALNVLDGHTHGAGTGNAAKRINSGLAAARPAFGNAGHVYWSTDVPRLSLDTGAGWLDAVLNGSAAAVSLGGGLTVTAGGAGIGQAPAATAGLIIATGAATDATNRYGLFLAAQSGASGANESLHAVGTVTFDGSFNAQSFVFAGSGSIGGTLTVRDVTITTPPSFAASDKYLVIDASGHIHKSALGPAS